jgi:hypothetical protein
VGKPEEMIQFGRPKHRWEDIFKRIFEKRHELD